jgi:formamidopyrimidine-DNA glycosylase
MPELPEVEHTRQNLIRWGVVGSRIAKVTTTDKRIVRPKTPRAFVSGLKDKTISAIDRKGKWLRFSFAKEEEKKLYVHLGMTGWFENPNEVLVNPLQSARAADGADPLRFERVRFELVGGQDVVYVDPRRWGQMILTDEEIEGWTSLGPDPLEEGIDVKRLVKRLAKRKKQSIKEALMDQSVLAGVGNIHAIESLWKAEIDPRSSAAAIDEEAMRAIAKGLRWTIKRTLVDLDKGREVKTNPFKIYGRVGEPCPRCATELDRFDLGGRTTTCCPGCQQLIVTSQ